MSALARLDEALAPLGLTRLGRFNPAEDDGYLVGRGLTGGTLVLVGNGGPAFWRRSGGEVEDFAAKGSKSPLDDWTRAVMEPLAQELGLGVVFPFEGPPWPPFPTWAGRCPNLHHSPLGIMIHPRFGLWHGFRAALHFPERLAAEEESEPSPCDSCAGKPCLSACPVSAFSSEGYDAGACRSYLAQPERACWREGCLARLACPVGADQHYDREQMLFHMRAFVAAAAPDFPKRS